MCNLKGERSKKGVLKAKIHNRDCPKQDFSAEKQLTGSHSPTARGSWGQRLGSGGPVLRRGPGLTVKIL